MTEQLVDRTTGTKYGSAFTLGGMSSIFDGNKLANNPAFGAYLNGASSAWFAVHWPAGKVFSRAKVYGWNDRGFCDNQSGAAVTIAYYGKNGAFASGTDGSLLGTTTFNDTNDESAGREIFNGGDVNAYTDWACVVTINGTGVCIAEAEHWEITDGSPPPPPPPPPPSGGEALDVYLMWGQSHRRGDAPIQDQSAYLNRSRVMTCLPGTSAWIAAADPLSVQGSSPFETGLMGSSLQFADEISKLRPHRKVGVLVRAKGNQPISEFMPGSTLYNAMVADTQAALASAPVGSRIAGMASWQGESNNGSPSGWGANRLTIASSLRTAFGLPDLPDVMVCCDSRWTGILAEQLALGLPKNMARVRIDDQPVPGAGDITDPAVYRVIGRREAWAMAAMVRD